MERRDVRILNQSSEATLIISRRPTSAFILKGTQQPCRDLLLPYRIRHIHHLHPSPILLLQLKYLDAVLNFTSYNHPILLRLHSWLL